MRECGEEIDNSEIDGILKSVDKNGDGTIDYEEFCTMMRNQDFDALRTATHAMKTKQVVEPKVSKSWDAPDDDSSKAPSRKSSKIKPA